MKKYVILFISLLFLSSCALFQPKPEDESERLMRLAQQTAGSKLTDLTSLGAPAAAGDLIMLVDISDTTMGAGGTNKKITAQNLWANRRAPLNKTANYTVPATREAYGGIFTNTGATGAITFTLPNCVAGMTVTFILGAAYDIDIDPYGSERILVLTDTNGDKISSDAVLGSMITLYAVSATQWMRVGSVGTWSDAD